MATAYLINPRKKSRRRRKSAAGATHHKRRVRRNPRRKASRSSAPAAAPTRRRKRRSKSTRIQRARGGLRRRAKRTGLGGILNAEIMPALTGAAGALTVDVLMGYIPFPASVNTPSMRPLLKGAVAVGLGMVAARMGKAALGRDLAVGALTVALHDSGRGIVQQILPGANLGEYTGGSLGYYNPAPKLGEYVDGMPSTMAGIPFMSANPRANISPFPANGFQTGNFAVEAGGLDENFDY